jgi:integrase
VPRDRILDDDELRLLSMAVRRLDWPWRQFFTLALMTGQRREECAGMRWSEINLQIDNPAWVLPPSRTKNSREHTVPLSSQVVGMINGVERITDSPFVFTTTGRTSISGFSDGKERLDAAMLEIARKEAKARGGDPDAVTIAPWRIHDLRRTVASGMARLGVSVSVVEKVLNHVSGTFAGIVGVYQRHDFLAEKRHALSIWADHVAGLTTTRESNVVRLKMEEV